MDHFFKTITLAIGCGLFSLTGYAQQNVSIGLETGPSISSIRGKMVNDAVKSSLHFSGAVSVQCDINDKLSIRTAIGYERKGAKDFVELTSVNAQPLGEIPMYTRLDYLTVPILARLTSRTGKVNMFFNVGPYVGYLLKFTSNIEAYESQPATSYNHTASASRLDIGLSAGLGLSLPVNEQVAFSFEARNNLGVGNATKGSWISGGPEKNNSINLLFGVSYQLSK